MRHSSGERLLKKASQGVATLVARMGKAALAATVILWIAWFFMPGLGFSVNFFGVGQTKSFTLWDALSLDPINNMNPGSSGLLNLIVIVGIVAPLAASFIQHPQARYLYAAPLACLLIAWFTIQRELGQALALQQSRRRRQRRWHRDTPGYGAYISRWRALSLPRACSSARRATTLLPNHAAVTVLLRKIVFARIAEGR